MQNISPIIAGMRICFPDSDALYMLQTIFPLAINTTTDKPNHRLLFQNASPKRENETGTVRANNIFL